MENKQRRLKARITMATLAGILAGTAGCPSPAANDAGDASQTDAPRDTVTDVTMDAGTDVVVDTGTDVVTDTGTDVVTDTGTDVVTDTGVDVVDPCTVSNGGCDPLTTCSVADGGVECTACPSGYTGTGASGCADINECSANNGGCGASHCDNTAGSFTCTPVPTAILSRYESTTVQRGVTNGTIYTDTCPGGQVVIGYNVLYDSVVRGVQAICGTLNVSGPAFDVTITPGITQPRRGFGAMTSTVTCPANQMVVGFTGSNGALIDALAFRCAPLAITPDGSGGYGLTTGTVTTLAPAGGTGGGPIPNTDCPAGEFASGQTIAIGDWLFGFAQVCDRPIIHFSVPDVTYGAASDTAIRGALTGTEARDACPTGQVVVGYDFTGTGPLVSTRTHCGMVSLEGSVPTRVIVTRGVELATRGVPNGNPVVRVCPDDQMVVGFGGASGASIDSVIVRCAPFTLSTGTGSAFVLGTGTVTDLPAAGGTGGTMFPATNCPTGQVARGSIIGASVTMPFPGFTVSHVDAFGLSCAAPSAP